MKNEVKERSETILEKYICPFCNSAWDEPFKYADHIGVCACRERKEEDKKKAWEEIQKLEAQKKVLDEKLRLRKKEFDQKYNAESKKPKETETTGWTMIFEAPAVEEKLRGLLNLFEEKE